MPQAQQYPIDALKLTPAEKYLYQYHLNNLYGTGKVRQPSGDISTVLQSVVTGPDGRFYNIPTVWGGKILDPKMAAQQAARLGWKNWPSYGSVKDAERRYQQMHEYMERDVQGWSE